MTTSHHVPLRSGRVPAPAPCFGRPGPLHITSPPFRPGPCARALLRLARLLHYHVPSVQAGSLRPRPDSDSLDSNHVPLIRPAHIVRPGFSRALGSHPGPGLCSQRPRARDTGARTPDTTTEPSSACAFPSPENAIVDVLVPAPSRCRHVPRWGCWGGLVGLRLPRVRPLRPRHGTSSTPTRDYRPRRRSREPPWRRAPHR